MKRLLLLGVMLFSVNAQADSCHLLCSGIPALSDILKGFGLSSQEQLVPQGPTHRTLKFLSWNVYKGKKDALPEALNKLTQEANVVMLQEVTHDNRVKGALEQLQGWGWESAVMFFTKEGTPTSVAIGSKARAFNVQGIRSVDREPVINTPKMIILAEYALPGTTETLLAGSIHGMNSAGDKAIGRQLQAVVDIFKNHKGPAILIGDFNFKNTDRMILGSQVLAQAGLSRLTWENPPGSYQLDDGFVRGLIQTKAQYLNDVVDVSSDHPAMWVEARY